MARPELPTEGAAAARGAAGLQDGPYEFAAPVFDLAAPPDGSILVAEYTTIKEIRRRGGIEEIITVPTLEGSAVNGLEAIGRGNFFPASAGLDLAAGAGLWRVSHGSARLVADIEDWIVRFELDDGTDCHMQPVPTAVDSSGECSIVEDGLLLPGAITFDKWGDLWVVGNNIGYPVDLEDAPTEGPTVRRVDLP